MSETFGVWELLTRLGQDELGQTHLALRRTDQRRAVLKRFSPTVTQDLSFYRPLKLELEQASQLQHPSAAAVLEQGELGGSAFAAFEHVDGVSLVNLGRAAQATGGWPLSIERAVSLIGPVLEALSAAHSLTPPLLHREVVPHNVLVTCEGRVVLTDFGLGRARRRAGGVTAGMRAAYVSPEQARGNATDPRSEVFTAGLILFELVCGRLPAQGGVGEVISRIATGELDPPLAVNPQLDPAMVAVLQRALSDRPEARFASTREFSQALAGWDPQTAPESLAAWVTRLDGVKLEAPAPAPAPAPKPVAAAAPEPTALPPSAPRRKLRPIHWVGGALLGAVIAATQLFPFSPEVSRVDPSTVGRPLELLSVPSGAQVYLDGELLERRTPLTLSIPKDELRNLVLRKQGVGSWSGHVSNVRKLEITIATGAREEERYEGFRPEPKPAPAAEAEPVAADDQLPKPEVVFDAESPPLEVVLTAAHSVKADLGPSIELAAGSEGVLTTPATLYIGPSPRRLVGKSARQWMPSGRNTFGSFRQLNLFALRSSAGVVEVADLSQPVTFANGGTYHLFSPTESGESPSGQAELTIDGEPIMLTAQNLLRVDQDDSFLIRVLSPKVTYRLELSRADGSSDPLPAVLVSMRPSEKQTRHPAGAQESSILFDQEPVLTGQVIAGSGVHTLSGASNVWFTLLTARGVVPPSVKLSIRPASAEQRR